MIGMLGGALTLLLFVIPFPLATRSEGVVSLAEHSRIRAGTDCFITEILAEDGSEVDNGQPLVACEDPYLATEVRLLEANLAEIRARFLTESLQSRKNREILMEEIAAAEAQLVRAYERRDDLLISSPNQGVLTLPESRSLAGRFVEQGALLGYVLEPAQSVVVTVIDQADINLLREKTTKVELRLAGDIGTLRTAAIDRETPAASDTLPSPVLGLSGGGSVPVDPSDRKGVRTLNKIFLVEIKLPIPKERIRVGERAYIRFDHGSEPLGLQWYRSLRQLFLRQFHA
jgi:putative peptide zinc metalloprotease protein